MSLRYSGFKSKLLPVLFNISTDLVSKSVREGQKIAFCGYLQSWKQ